MYEQREERGKKTHKFTTTTTKAFFPLGGVS